MNTENIIQPGTHIHLKGILTSKKYVDGKIGRYAIHNITTSLGNKVIKKGRCPVDSESCIECWAVVKDIDDFGRIQITSCSIIKQQDIEYQEI